MWLAIGDHDWFNDVWMKEVFANFMADKVTEKLMGTRNL